MSSLHEFDVALSPGIASSASASRQMAREIHLNAWITGAKGGGIGIQLGSASITTTTGLTLVDARSVPPPLANAPTEIVLGSTQAAPGIVNLAEIFAVPNGVAGSMFTGFGIP